MGFEVWPALLCWRDFTQTVGKETQGPLRRNRRVKLTHCARCGVTWVDEGFLAFHALCDLLALALIELFKIIAAHVDLTANFENVRDINGQTNWYLSNGSNVLRHVFTGFAVPTRSGLHQHAVLVAQAHCQAVKFGFGHVFNRRVACCQTQLLANACVKILRACGFRIRLGADAQHRQRVAPAGKTIQGLAADALCGRVRRDQLRMRGLQRLQLLEQAVVFGIGDLRIVQHVVAVRVRMQLAAQRLQFIHRQHGALTLCINSVTCIFRARCGKHASADKIFLTPDCQKHPAFRGGIRPTAHSAPRQSPASAKCWDITDCSSLMPLR